VQLKRPQPTADQSVDKEFKEKSFCERSFRIGYSDCDGNRRH
jgi:hypothetical protein